MWLDELHHWQLGRDSATLNELFHNARMMYIRCYGIVFIHLNPLYAHPLWMQVLNLSFSCIAAVLILKYAPFSRI